VYIADVSVPDENGNMSLGPVGTFNGYQAAKLAKKVIVQVNREVPYVYGTKGSFSQCSRRGLYLRGDHKVPELPSIPLTDMEKAIAHNVIPYIENGSTIQIGVVAWAMLWVSIWNIIKTWASIQRCLFDSMVHLRK